MKEKKSMANMSYCRFENTLPDFRDCYDNFDDNDLSEEEKRARRKMIALCVVIALDYGYEIGSEIERVD